MRRAVVLGATGAVGSALVRELLASGAWSAVLILVRRSTDAFAGSEAARKLTIRVVEMEQLERDARTALAAPEWSSSTEPVSAFCTLGVGQPRKVPREVFRHVDVDYPAAFSRACKAADVKHMTLLSSVGAYAASSSFYLRVKGEAEAAIAAPGFERVSLFRPSQLMTDHIRYGLQDRVAQWLFPRISPLLPSKWRGIHVDTLARAMRLNAERPARDRVEVLHWEDFRALVG